MPLPAGIGLVHENIWTGINDIAENDVYVYDSSNETGRASIDIQFLRTVI